MKVVVRRILEWFWFEVQVTEPISYMWYIAAVVWSAYLTLFGLWIHKEILWMTTIA